MDSEAARKGEITKMVVACFPTIQGTHGDLLTRDQAVTIEKLCQAIATHTELLQCESDKKTRVNLAHQRDNIALRAQLAVAEGEITKTKDDRSYWASRCHDNVLEANALRDERDALTVERDGLRDHAIILEARSLSLEAASEQARQMLAEYLGLGTLPYSRIDQAQKIIRERLADG